MERSEMHFLPMHMMTWASSFAKVMKNEQDGAMIPFMVVEYVQTIDRD
jgi:hypothetical protein